MEVYSSPHLSIDYQHLKDENREVFYPKGEIDMSTSSEVGKLLLKAIQLDSTEAIDINLRSTEFIDCSTVGTFVTALNEARDRGKLFTIQDPKPSAMKILHLSELDHIVNTPPKRIGN